MTSLGRISELSAKKPDMKFTSLFRLITIDFLIESNNELKPGKAVGIDGITKEDYEKDLRKNLTDLHTRLWNGTYKPKPARKVEIPKDNGKLRSLSIYCYEDKLVQEVIKRIVEAVYEPIFYNEQMGYRPNRNCHMALALLNNYIEKNYTNYVLDADIKGFFDHLQHKWLLKMLGGKISDPKFLALIHKMLRAGIMEGTYYEATTEGSGQGSVCSPVLANVYMHYVLIWWYHEMVKPGINGFTGLVVYADDFVMCFQHKVDAETCQRRLRARLKTYGLELAEDKTRLIEFGKFAEENSRKRKGRAPETFTFLGFTHYCSKSRPKPGCESGEFRVKRRTSNKKFSKKMKEMNTKIRNMRGCRLDYIAQRLNEVFEGYDRYYGITDNYPRLNAFHRQVIKLLFKWLNRRSQRRSYTWEQFTDLLKWMDLVKPRIRVNIYDVPMTVR